jgi:ATP-binding cassette subfamily F protein uup
MVPIFYIKEGNLSFADKKILSELLSFMSLRGDRICLVGRNGCGKSSLMKVIDGMNMSLTTGELFQDPAIKIGYLKARYEIATKAGKIYDFVLSSFEGEQDRANKYQADIILKQLSIDGNAELEVTVPAGRSGGYA